MQSAFDVLQIPHVLQQIAGYTKTAQGKEAILSLRPLKEASRVHESRQLSQAMELIDSSGAFPLGESVDLSSRVDVAKKGGTLNEEDFSRVLNDLNTLHDVKRHLAHLTVQNDLSASVLGLPDIEPLRQGILRVLNPDLTIRDNASPELKRIRSTLARKKKDLTAKLGAILEAHRPYLSGNSWTMRNGHYVLPVANSHKHSVKGLIQDVSSSGGTTFIEPEFLVQLHNDIALLEADEREEIRRILSTLSRILGNNASEFLRVNVTIGILDFLQAKVLYAQENDAHLASLSEDGGLFIGKARHPLIDKSKVVANDFALSPSRRILVLSGPNAGGKTVALKTLGILAMMFQMALPLPCALGAEMPNFGHVLLDIGDSQSIFDNLSTFSGHVRNIKDILEVAKKGDLILLDEVGTGTSPKEGEALAMAILDELRDRGCYALISSHFEALKAKALSSSDVENASLLFDEETLSPTYLLRVGLPGESYGLEVARRLGLQESVLEHAKEYLSSDGQDHSVSASLRHLGELTRQAEEKDKELDELRRDLRQKEGELSRLKHELERKQKNFEAEMKKAKDEILAKAQEEVDEAIKILRNPDVRLHEAIQAKKSLDNLVEEKVEKRFDGNVEVGDYVEIPDYEISGRITKKSGDKIEVVDRDGKTFRTSAKSVVRIDAPKEEKKKVAVTNVDALPTQSLSLECNIIGMRVDEAMVAVDRYLDRCRLKGFKRVRIIHGLGSGALRRATHEYCKSHASFIEKYELGGEFEGGGGATVVYLK